MQLDKIHVIIDNERRSYDWPILAQSEPWENAARQKQDREMNATFAIALIAGVVLAAWLIVWWHPW